MIDQESIKTNQSVNQLSIIKSSPYTDSNELEPVFGAIYTSWEGTHRPLLSLQRVPQADDGCLEEAIGIGKRGNLSENL